MDFSNYFEMLDSALSSYQGKRNGWHLDKSIINSVLIESTLINFCTLYPSYSLILTATKKGTKYNKKPANKNIHLSP